VGRSFHTSVSHHVSHLSFTPQFYVHLTMHLTTFGVPRCHSDKRNSLNHMSKLAASFDVCRSKSVEGLKLLNRVIFQGIPISDAVYKECCATDLTQLAYHNDILIGAIACRLEKLPNGKTRVYVISLGVLAPYRGYGVGSSLVNNLISSATKDASIEELQCHVQASNEEAIKFYERFDFKQGEKIEGYYKKLPMEDQAAIVFTRKM
jgi:GNAT superfamily N-acetyltransferase